jgi:enamine deaminase RidA (YjgF/YER057c/UK114 family)
MGKTIVPTVPVDTPAIALKEIQHMTDRQLIIPAPMHRIVERAGYVPAVKVGKTLYCAGQVGRTAALEVILDPEAQFVAAWQNLRLVLEEGGCTFEDVVDMTTYHVNMSEHMAVFRDVKNRLFPRGLCDWTTIGVSELAHPGLLVEIKCVAVQR